MRWLTLALPLTLVGCLGTCDSMGGGSFAARSMGGGSMIGGAFGQTNAAAGNACNAAIPGTLIHHYAARLETFADEDAVGTITDQAGSEDLTQGTEASKPSFETDGINGQPFFDFDGGDFVDGATEGLAEAQPFYICLVYNTGAAEDEEVLITTHGHATTFNLKTDPSPFEFKGQSAGTAIISTDGATVSSWHLFCGVFDGASSALWVDGVEDTTGTMGTGNLEEIRVGANPTNPNPLRHIAGGIAEILIWGADPDMDAVEAALEGADCYGSNFPISDVLP